MHTRPVARADLGQAATIYFDACDTKDDIREALYLHRHKYPQSFMKTMLRSCVWLYSQPNTVGFVAVADEQDVQPGGRLAETGVKAGEVIGVAFWAREFDDAYRGPRSGLFWTVESALQRIERYYYNIFNPDPSKDHEAYRRILDIAEHQFATLPINKSPGTPHWLLDLLMVAPAVHGKGVGGMLLQWGCDQALKELSPSRQILALYGSPQGRFLYEKYGFRVVGTVEEGPTLLKIGDCMPHSAFLWDPNGHWTMPRDGRGPDPSEKERLAGYKDYVLFKPEFTYETKEERTTPASGTVEKVEVTPEAIIST